MTKPNADELLKLRPPKSVLQITRDLENAGFEVWAVGGAVRDALLGQPHLDWDLATSATPAQVRELFGHKRTIPVGVEFGTVGVLDRQGRLHEVTTFRRDVKTDGRHAEVEFGASLDDDLARRDFTINAIAYSPSREVIRDPFDGRGDLRRGLVRAVGNPADRMREDRLRALRAIRFSARFDFQLDPGTWTALKASAPHLGRLSAERVKQELEKTMEQVAAPSRALTLWRDSGAFAALIPELAHVAETVLRAVDCAAVPGLPRRPGRRLIRLAILLSAVPHADLYPLAMRLRFSKADAQWIATLGELWQGLAERLTQLLTGHPGDRDLRRLISAIGRARLHTFFRLASAHWAARRLTDPAAPAAQAVHSVYRRSLRIALRDPVDLRDLAVDGDDLRQLGIRPGPELGKILSALLALVLDDPGLNTRERLLEEARRLMSG